MTPALFARTLVGGARKRSAHEYPLQVSSIDGLEALLEQILVLDDYAQSRKVARRPLHLDSLERTAGARPKRTEMIPNLTRFAPRAIVVWNF